MRIFLRNGQNQQGTTRSASTLSNAAAASTSSVRLSPERAKRMSGSSPSSVLAHGPHALQGPGGQAASNFSACACGLSAMRRFPVSKDTFLRTTSPVKELPGPVPLQPLFKNTQVIRIGLHVLHQYLVRNGMCRSRRTVTVLLVVHGTENGGIGDLDLVEMQNGKHRAGRWQG